MNGELNQSREPEGLGDAACEPGAGTQAANREQLLLIAATANAKFRAFFDQGPLFAGVMALDGTLLEANRLSLEACGYTKDQVIGRKFWECPWWSPSAELKQLIRVGTEKAAAGERFQIEMPYFVADGSQRMVDFNLQPIKDESGTIIFLAPTGTDITDRKLAETRHAKIEERLRLLWEAAAVLLTTDDPDTMLKKLFAKIAPTLLLDTYFNFMVNESKNGLCLASCTGIPEEAIPGLQTLEFGQAVCGTVALQRKAIIATSIQESDDPKVQLVKSFGIRAYACNPLMAGEELLGTLSFASHHRDQFADDELDFLQTICQYVTAAYERLRLIAKLQEADRRKDEFLATLAHELRNPLAPLRNGLQVMKLAKDDARVVEDSRQMMERQLGQMVRLIDDLLDLSRISRGRVELRKERVELAKAIHQAVESSRPTVELAGHELTVTLPAAPIHVEADLTRLSQVFANLLNNAAKYTERGGRISLAVERQGSDAVICVKDNGVGIPAHMLSRVFDMFTQVDQSLEKSQGGLGIGLSLVKWLVEMHGGNVEARSEGRGRGSEFIVRLPIVLTATNDQPILRSERVAASPSRRILVVDDNRDAAMSLALMLKIMGNEIRTAHDGLEALEVTNEFVPDLVMLDIGMPKLNGYDTARRMRELPWGKSATLVALTGWGQDEDKRKSMEAGFDFHMVKPVELGALNQLLQSLPVRC